MVFLCSRTLANFRGGEWGFVRRVDVLTPFAPKFEWEVEGEPLQSPEDSLVQSSCNAKFLPMHPLQFTSNCRSNYSNVLEEPTYLIRGQIPIEEALDLGRTKLLFL